MRSLQRDIGKRVMIGDFGNDHAVGNLLELHVVADGVALVEFCKSHDCGFLLRA